MSTISKEEVIERISGWQSAMVGNCCAKSSDCDEEDEKLDEVLAWIEEATPRGER